MYSVSLCDGGDQQGIDTVGALNDMITQDDMREIVLVQEAFQERKIGEIAKADRRSSGGKVCSDRRTFFFRQDNIFTSLIHSAQSERASSTSDFCR